MHRKRDQQKILIMESGMERLIQLYEEREILWNLQNSNYHKKDQREKALAEMSAALGLSGKLVV